MHPDTGTLLAWWDRELEPRKGARVARHMRGCASCREHLDEAVRELDRFLAEGGAGRLDLPGEEQQALARLLEAARLRAAAAEQGGEPHFADVQQRVGAALETYFGRAAAERFARAYGEADSDDMVRALENLLAAYMGQQAAATVMTDILNGGVRRCA